MNVNSHTIDAAISPEPLVPSALRIGERQNRPSKDGQNAQHARTKQALGSMPNRVTLRPYQPRPETRPNSPRPVGIAFSLFPAQRSPNSTRLRSSKLETPGTILSTLRSEHHKTLEESAPHLNQTGKYLHVDFLIQVEHTEPRPTHPRRNAPTLIFHSREPRTTSSDHLNLTTHEFRVRPNTEKRNPYHRRRPFRVGVMLGYSNKPYGTNLDFPAENQWPRHARVGLPQRQFCIFAHLFDPDINASRPNPTPSWHPGTELGKLRVSCPTKRPTERAS
jgi:hypothetical protein